ncbi:MAG: AEC family transporter [Nitrospinota bacterium]|nr:AEC family transporter [Nitrospinota bacterium]
MASNLIHVLQIVSPAFLIIALGYGFSRFIQNSNEALIKITMGILVPAFAWEHLYRMKLEGSVITDVLLSSVIIMLVPGLIAWGVFRLKRISPRGIYLPIMFMNSVNLPFPILLAAYGESAIPFALMFYLTAFLGIFTLGLVIVSGGKEKGILQVFREPVVYVVLCALLFNWGDIEVPMFINNSAHLLAQATIPMVLMALGIQLSQVKITGLKLSLIAVAIRFIGGALTGVFCVWLFQLEGLAYKVVILESVMPCAVITSLVAEKYRAQPEVVASTIFISTLLAIIIIPCTLILLG